MTVSIWNTLYPKTCFLYWNGAKVHVPTNKFCNMPLIYSYIILQSARNNLQHDNVLDDNGHWDVHVL